MRAADLNVILICTDTFRADYMGCYGNDWIETPYLDKLASEGVLFEDAYAEALSTRSRQKNSSASRRSTPGSVPSWTDGSAT